MDRKCTGAREQVVEPGTRALLADMRGLCLVEEQRDCWSRHVADLHERCLLHERARPLLRHLLGVLDVAVDLPEAAAALRVPGAHGSAFSATRTPAALAAGVSVGTGGGECPQSAPTAAAALEGMARAFAEHARLLASGVRGLSAYGRRELAGLALLLEDFLV
jgi:hypothetical protein